MVHRTKYSMSIGKTNIEFEKDRRRPALYVKVLHFVFIFGPITYTAALRNQDLKSFRRHMSRTHTYSSEVRRAVHTCEMMAVLCKKPKWIILRLSVWNVQYLDRRPILNELNLEQREHIPFWVRHNWINENNYSTLYFRCVWQCYALAALFVIMSKLLMILFHYVVRKEKYYIYPRWFKTFWLWKKASKNDWSPSQLTH